VFKHESETWLVISTLFENEGFLSVTASHVHCKCGNILETVQDEDVAEVH